MRSRPSGGRATGRRSTRWPGWWPPGATAPSTACDASGRSQDKTRLLEADQPAATMDEIDLDDSTIPDERLELIFTCCHPALAVEAQVALTLRALGGLTTEEIARAFLVSEETMKRRLSRAKAKIKATAIPFAVPADRVLPGPLGGRAGGRLPDLQPGLPRSRRSRRRGDPAGAAAGRADGRRARGVRAARPDAAARLAPRGARGRRSAGPAGRAGPLPPRPGEGRGGPRRTRASAGPAAGGRAVRAPGGDRLAPGRARRSTGTRSRCSTSGSSS